MRSLTERSVLCFRYVLWAAALTASVSLAQTTRPYPLYEDYPRDEWPRYIGDVRDWVQANPASPQAPRVLLDAYSAGGAFGDSATQGDMRGWLLLSYGQSVPGRYVCGTFKDAGDFSTQLIEAIRGALSKPWDRTRAGSVLAAIEQGYLVHGRKIFDNHELALACIIMSRQQPAAKLQEAAIASLQGQARRDPETQSMIQIVLDPDQTDACRTIERLHALRRAWLFEWLLLGDLKPEQNAQPSMRLVRCELLLNRGRPGGFPEAAALLQGLPAGYGGAKVLCLRAWCAAAAGEAAVASEFAEAANTSYPDDPWSAQAKQIALAAGDQARLLDQYAAELAQLGQSFQQDIDTLEVSIQIAKEKSSPIKIYAGLSPEAFEFQVVSGMTLKCAYRTEAQACRILLAEQGMIYSFREGGVLPGPNFSLKRLPEGFSWGMDMQLTDRGQALKESLRSLASSEYLSTPKGLREMLAHTLRRGSLVLAPTEAGQSRTYTWIHPACDKPASEHWQLTVEDGRLTRIAGDNSSATLRYGTAELVTLKPPPWPTARVVTQDRMEVTSFMRVMQSIIAMVQEE